MAPRRKVFLYGASGHAKVILDILHANGIAVKALIDDNPQLSGLAGIEVLHSAAGLSPIIISIGNNRIRKLIAERLDCEFGISKDWDRDGSNGRNDDKCGRTHRPTLYYQYQRFDRP